METKDTTHLVALQKGLSAEKERLHTAKGKEAELRSVWVAQLEKEIADEFKFLGIEPSVPEMSDDELMKELLGV